MRTNLYHHAASNIFISQPNKYVPTYTNYKWFSSRDIGALVQWLKLPGKSEIAGSSPLTRKDSVLCGASLTERKRARPQTARSLILNYTCVNSRCHLIHLTILRMFFCSSLAYMCTNVPKTPFIHSRDINRKELQFVIKNGHYFLEIAKLWPEPFNFNGQAVNCPLIIYIISGICAILKLFLCRNFPFI